MPSWKKIIISGSDASLNSLYVENSVTASAFSGSFYGDGSGLTGIQFEIGDVASFSQPFTDQTTVTVNHLLNSQYPFVQIYESGSNEQIIPLSVKVLDSSSIEVSFTENVSGYVVVAKGGHIIQGTTENSNLLDGNPSSYYLDYTNFTNIPQGLVSGSSQLTSSYDLRYALSGSSGGGTADWNTLENRPEGIVSSSAQIIPLLPTGTVSGSSQVQFLSISDIPTGLVSASSQVDATQTTNFETGVKTRLNVENVVSSSAQVVDILVPLNAFSASAITRLNNLETTTQSLDQRLDSFEAVSSSYARTDVNNTFSGLQTFNNISVNGTASFAYIESVTGSAKIIGDAFIVLNVSVPAERFGGLQVVDSGSGFTTSSFLYDGLNNNWVFQHEGSEDSGSSVAIFGPLSLDGLGTEVGLTENRIPKAVTDHGHHIGDSNITDTGTIVSINSNTQVTGSFRADTYLNLPAGIISGSTQISENIRTERLEMGVHFPGSTITTGAKGRKTFGQSGTIIGWKLVSDTSTSTVIDIWKANNSIPTNANSITGTAKPTLSSAQLASSTTLTGWTTSVTAGDVFILEVESNNNASYIYLELDILLS
jgi:hypothetical protein